MYNFTLEDVYKVSMKSESEFIDFCMIKYPDDRLWPESALNYALYFINNLLYKENHEDNKNNTW